MKAIGLKSIAPILAILIFVAFQSRASSNASPSGPKAPVLVTPVAGAVLPQPESGLWIFEWKSVRKAKQYEIYIIAAEATFPLADSITPSTHFVVPQRGGYIIDRHLKGWTWRVRAQDKNGQLGSWSESRQFDVAPMARGTVSPAPSAGYYIRGELRDSAGNLVPGAPVCTVKGGYRICSPTNSGGQFILQVNGEGRYEVIPGDIPTRPATDIFTATDAYPAVHNGREVTLDNANRMATINLTLPETNPELNVKIVDGTTGLPVELIVLQVCYAHQLLNCGGDFFRSDTGEYRIRVPSQDFNLSVRAPDYEEWASFDNKGMKPGSAQSLAIVMRRSAEAAGEALHESEKRVGVNLPAPAQLAPAENEKLLRAPRTTTLQWEKVAGASRYEVEVDYCRNSSDPKQCLNPTPLVFVFPALGKSPNPNTTEDTSLTFDFVGAQPGRWRVWAVDNDGRKGFKSPWRTFIYLR
jgi:hypothetical protein